MAKGYLQCRSIRNQSLQHQSCEHSRNFDKGIVQVLVQKKPAKMDFDKYEFNADVNINKVRIRFRLSL